MKRPMLFAFVLLSGLAATARAEYFFIGAGGEFFDEANWVDVSSNNPPAGSIDDGVGLSMDARITGAAGVTATTSGSFTGVYLGGNNLLLDSTSMVITGTGGLRDGNAYLTNGSTLEAQFIGRHIRVGIDSTSALSLRGGGNPVNTGEDSQPTPGPAMTGIDLLGIGSTLIFLNETPTSSQTEHLSKITVAGEPAVVGLNVEVIPFNGAAGSMWVATVPEPAAGVALLIGLTAMSLRRRRA